jgi:hypothetical protein
MTYVHHILEVIPRAASGPELISTNLTITSSSVGFEVMTAVSKLRSADM